MRYEALTPSPHRKRLTVSIKQKVILLILAVVLLLGGLAAVTIVTTVDGGRHAADPTLLSILGTFTTVILLIVALVQNQQSIEKTDKVHDLVNGSLEERMEAVVRRVIAPAPPELVPPTTPTPVVDPAAPPMRAGA